jgi:hypothetical protein
MKTCDIQVLLVCAFELDDFDLNGQFVTGCVCCYRGKLAQVGRTIRGNFDTQSLQYRQQDAAQPFVGTCRRGQSSTEQKTLRGTTITLERVASTSRKNGRFAHTCQHVFLLGTTDTV